MIEEKRRESRARAGLAITLELRAESEDSLLAGPVDGRMENWSPLGAALLLTRVHFPHYHLFYSPQEDSAKSLLLAAAEDLTIPVRPIWFNFEIDGSAMPYIMGVEFLLDPGSEEIKRLLRLTRQGHKGIGERLRELF